MSGFVIVGFLELPKPNDFGLGEFARVVVGQFKGQKKEWKRARLAVRPLVSAVHVRLLSKSWRQYGPDCGDCQDIYLAGISPTLSLVPLIAW
jgi:hypothetical protein